MQPSDSPNLPLLIFDGDCGFCRYWIYQWQRMVGSNVRFAPLQDEDAWRHFPELSNEKLSGSVHLCFPDGKILNGAEAVFQLFEIAGHQLPMLAYRRVPGFSFCTELGYNLVARNRMFVSWCLRMLVGRLDVIPEYQVTTVLFQRILGAVLTIAFLSLLLQMETLLGSNGLSPAADYLQRVDEVAQERQISADRYRLVPSVFWINSSDSFLFTSALIGLVFSLFTIAGRWRNQALFGAFLIYLSFVSVGQAFFAFQWDTLLLEVVFLGAFATTWTRASNPQPAQINRWGILALRVLLFKLMLASGCVKLLSQDALWRDLTALTVHYETQPLPTPFAWSIHQFPVWFHRLCCGGMFLIELVISFMILAPRRWRLLAAGLNIALQIVILFTGNYGFFNWLTLALCLMLLDDQALKKLLPTRLWRILAMPPASAPAEKGRNRFRLGTLLAIAMIFVSGLQLWSQLLVSRVPIPRAVQQIPNWLAPFHVNNRYGLFAAMTPTRPELTIQGSNDGVTWEDYHFHYKPGRSDVGLPWVAPHQPRVDWQMWFAALGRYEHNPWLVNLCRQLLEGNPRIERLFSENPFPHTPPRQIRVVTQPYRFTDRSTRERTGDIWERGEQQLYLPPISSPN